MEKVSISAILFFFVLFFFPRHTWLADSTKVGLHSGVYPVNR